MKKNSQIISILNRYLPSQSNSQVNPSNNSLPNPSVDPVIVSENHSNFIDEENNSEGSEDRENDQNFSQIEPETQADIFNSAPNGNYEYGNLEYWTNAPFPWSDRLLASMMHFFGIDSFRPIQKAAINATLSKRDVFLCVPTGGGKSLIFQLPAILNKGITVVFMPLIALMQDQTAQLQEKGISVLNLSGQTGLYAQSNFPSILKQCTEALVKDTEGDFSYPRMIFLSPEKIAKNETANKFLHDLYNLGMIERFVIDEAHCVSMWGHEFRQEYLNLKKLKTEFPGVPTLAMTATATEDYREDIIKQLGMTDVVYFQNSFNRENLVFEVRAKNKKDDILQIADFINENYPGKSGIIYATCRNEAETISQALIMRFNMKCAFYHAKMCDKVRKDTQNAWMKGDIHIIVATIAFGMGINKPDVRFVIHFNLSKSLAHYYQEAGRAGRDGAKSHCIIYYDPFDRKILEYFIASSQGSDEAKKESAWELYNMIRYCENLYTCRRVISLAYFGEWFNKSECKGLCDICQANKTGRLVNVTETAKAIVNFIRQARNGGYRFEELPKMLLGIGKKYERKKVLDNSFNKNEIIQIINEMIISRILCLEYKIVQTNRRETFNARICVGSTSNVEPLIQGSKKVEVHFPVFTMRILRGLRPNERTRSRRNLQSNRNDGSNDNHEISSGDEDNDNDGLGSFGKINGNCNQSQGLVRRRNEEQKTQEYSNSNNYFQPQAFESQVGNRNNSSEENKEQIRRNENANMLNNELSSYGYPLENGNGIDENIKEPENEQASTEISLFSLISKLNTVRQKAPSGYSNSQEVKLSSLQNSNQNSLSQVLRPSNQIFSGSQTIYSRAHQDVIRKETENNSNVINQLSSHPNHLRRRYEGENPLSFAETKKMKRDG